MELVKSRGFVLFTIMVLGFCFLSTANVKTKDDMKEVDNSYVYSNVN